jgi:serine/threonine-protein kinase
MLGGRYQIVEQIGKGGFSSTFLALDMQRPGNPKCVVKQFKPMSTDPYTLREGRRLFDKEAEILEILGTHAQIPRLLAHFEENQEFYLVQEFIEGHDLNEEVFPGKQLSEAYVIKLLQDILEVLVFVHGHTVIHRDIKPSNIRRRQDGKIVLIDFGAVKQISTQVVNSQGQTNVTVAIGTPGYMPSEQAISNPQFSSDIYAVGIIGIQALTGIFPTQLSKNSQTSEIDWRNQAQVSQKLADILDTMVRYDFRQRYQSATDALQALTVPPITPPQPPPPTNKFLIAAGIAAVVATSIVIVPKFIDIVNLDPKTENFLAYQNSTAGIKMKYPQSWERQDINNPLTGEVVVFLSPKQSNADKFQEKVTISVEDFSGTLDEFTDSSKKDISNHLTEANIINTSEINLAYQRANQLVFTGKDGNNSLKNWQVLTLRNYQAYIITYTAETNNYDAFSQKAETMVNSFEFLE